MTAAYQRMWRQIEDQQRLASCEWCALAVGTIYRARYWAVLLVVAIISAWAVSNALAHDHYSSWVRPDTGSSCCSAVDCYPTQAAFKGGSWWAVRREDSAWVKIPDAKILKNQVSPDGKAHLCATLSGIYCFVTPESGT